MKSILTVLFAAVLFQLPAFASETAIFAGGCFWCMEPPFDKLNGVTETTSGYSGGDSANPTYEEVSKDTTGHREVIRVTFDPKKVSRGFERKRCSEIENQTTCSLQYRLDLKTI